MPRSHIHRYIYMYTGTATTTLTAPNLEEFYVYMIILIPLEIPRIAAPPTASSALWSSLSHPNDSLSLASYILMAQGGHDDHDH